MKMSVVVKTVNHNRLQLPDPPGEELIPGTQLLLRDAIMDRLVFVNNLHDKLTNYFITLI